MKIGELKAKIKSAALAQPSINQFEMDWASIINESPENQYDLFLLMPPKKRMNINTDGRFAFWNLQFYLFALNNSSGEDMSLDERDAVWNDLEVVAENAMASFLSNRQEAAATSELSTEYDDGTIGSDDLIWVKCEITVRTTKYCP